MKFSLNILLLLMVACTGARCQVKIQVIKVSCIAPYCGGARPSPEMLAAGEKIRPYAGKTVIIVSEKGHADSAKTDTAGLFHKKLAAGKYKLYEPWRYYKKTQNGDPLKNFDAGCLKTEWAKPFMEVIVTRSSLTQKSDSPIILNCDWNAPCLLDAIKAQRMPQ